MYKSILSLFFLFLSVSLCAQTKLPRRSKLPVSLKEVSGLALTPDAKLWALNDGGNTADLFQFDAQTLQLVEVRRLPVQNRDWEELAADDKGHLYIGDFGNNGNRRKDLRIYRYDPKSGALDSILFRYPDQQAFPPASKHDWNFDCEAMVFFNDSLHLFSKSHFKGSYYCKHYVLPAQPGEYVPDLRDSVYLKKRAVSGAAISQDGRTLALTAYYLGFFLKFVPYTRAHAYFFADYARDGFLKSSIRRKRLPKCLIARQFESIVFWQPSLWLAANEGIGPQRAAFWRLKQR